MWAGDAAPGVTRSWAEFSLELLNCSDRACGCSRLLGFSLQVVLLGHNYAEICKGNCTCVLSPWTVSSSASGQRLTGGEDSVAMWIKSVVHGGFESQSFAKTVVFVLLLTWLYWTSPVFGGFLLLNWGLSLQQTALARGVTLAEELSLKLLQLLPYPCAVCLRAGSEPLLNFRIQESGL